MDKPNQPIAWISAESLGRLKQGGNDSRGTVPVHAKQSRAAKVPLFVATQMSTSYCHADAETWSRMFETAEERDKLRKELHELKTQAMFNTSTIERLRAEVAALRERDEFLLAATRDAQSYASNYVGKALELQAEVFTLTEQMKAREKDAARYQWFRRHENWRDSGPYDHLYEEELDAAIDAVIARDGQC